MSRKAGTRTRFATRSGVERDTIQVMNTAPANHAQRGLEAVAVTVAGSSPGGRFLRHGRGSGARGVEAGSSSVLASGSPYSSSGGRWWRLGKEPDKAFAASPGIPVPAGGFDAGNPAFPDNRNLRRTGLPP